MVISVIKRNGNKVDFNKDKIVEAILKANKDVQGRQKASVKLAKDIAKNIEGFEKQKLSVEEIQDMVEKELMSAEKFDLAKSYILYREKRAMVRQSNTTDISIKELIDGTNDYWNTENSNKNARVVTTQRDYLAGITSTDITRRFLLPEEVVKAHDEGILHFHDADYFAQKTLSNCFRGDTKFISSDGVRPFCSYKDGDEVFVPTHTGEWKKAKVRKYGVQKLDLVTFKRGSWSEKQFYVTSNHRWLLKDGTETTDLKINDYLYSTPNISEFEWDDLSIDEKILWCKGFAYGDGTTIHFATCDYTSVRLCGRKNRYADYFIEAGFNVTYPNSQDGDASVKIPNFNKNILPDMHTPEEFKIFTNGYLCADGHHTNIKGGSSKNEFRGIQITGAKKCKDVYDLLNKSGYYVSSISDLTNQNTNYGARTDATYLYRFQAKQSYRNWRVTNIQKDIQECEVWCLEVEDNHSFILEGGIVTGNCCLINLNDMLQNGTVINGVMIEKPHRFITAATIATQIILGVSSSQYGGCTITLSHLAPFVRDSYNKFLKKYIDWGFDEEKAKECALKDTKKEVADGVQTFNYQVNSMTNTNGQAPFLSVCMYLGETEEYKDELAMIIEEFLNQRILGFKNEQGVYITPAFPKLLYILEEDNIHKDSKYWYLTELAAKCTAKRMVPDYISEKMIKENKINQYGDGDCYPCINENCA